MPDDEQTLREQRQRELDEHDRIMARSAAHAARDTLHDASAGQQPGAYTTFEARDRAAHTPSILEREEPRNRQEEERMIAALHKELFPTDKEWRAYREEGAAAFAAQAPVGEHKNFQVDAMKTPAKEETPMTPEQQANIDKALAQANINDKMGGPSEAGGKATPNDPMPMDKSRDIGQDLQKQGVTMDKD